MKEKTLIAGLALLLFAFDAGADRVALVSESIPLLDNIETEVISREKLSSPLAIQRLHCSKDGYLGIWFVDKTRKRKYVLSKNNNIQIVGSTWEETMNAAPFYHPMLRAKSLLQEQLSKQGAFDATYDGKA